MTRLFSLGFSDNMYAVNLQTEQDSEGQAILRVFTSLRGEESPTAAVKHSSHGSVLRGPLETITMSETPLQIIKPSNEGSCAGIELTSLNCS